MIGSKTEIQPLDIGKDYFSEQEATVREDFGKLLIKSIHDGALHEFDRILARQDPFSKKLRSLLQPWDAQQQEIVRQCISCVVRAGLHDFLFQLHEHGDSDLSDIDWDNLDEGERAQLKDYKQNIQVLVDTIDVTTTSDGLHGLLFGDDGWIKLYSDHLEYDKIGFKAVNLD